MVSIRIFSIVFIVFSLSVNVKSQTCENTSQYGLCSSNSACGCLPITFDDNISICGLISVSCSRLNPCQSGDTCQDDDYICVHHPRCSSTPLCYPLSMIDKRLCPPMTPSITRTTTPFFTTQTATTSSFVTTTRSFITTKATTARSFTTSETTTAKMETTDYDSHYFTTDSFPSSGSIMSNYSNELTTNNKKIPNTNKYYQAIEIFVNTSGYYDIRSLSNIDTYGCLYRGNYNPSDSSNQITCNDDYMNRQFRLSSFLEAGVSYTLLFTTYDSYITGSYSVVGYGPGEIEFNSVGNFQTTMNTPIYLTSTDSHEFTSNYSGEFISNYSGALTLNSGIFSRPGSSSGSYHYYEAIQINVNTTGTYTFISQGSISESNTSESNMDTTDTYTFTNQSYISQGNMDTYGYIYQDRFYPSNPTVNLLQQDDDSGGNRQFRLTISCRSDITYVLVFTTYSGGITGPFSIVASGPDNVIFNSINPYGK